VNPCKRRLRLLKQTIRNLTSDSSAQVMGGKVIVPMDTEGCTVGFACTLVDCPSIDTCAACTTNYPPCTAWGSVCFC
jgi:hypothetical protein